MSENLRDSFRGTTRSRVDASPRRAGRVLAGGFFRRLLSQPGHHAGTSGVWNRLVAAAAAFAAVQQLDGNAPVDVSVAGPAGSRGFFVLAEPRSPVANARTRGFDRLTQDAPPEVASAGSPAAAAT